MFNIMVGYSYTLPLGTLSRRWDCPNGFLSVGHAPFICDDTSYPSQLASALVRDGKPYLYLAYYLQYCARSHNPLFTPKKSRETNEYGFTAPPQHTAGKPFYTIQPFSQHYYSGLAVAPDVLQQVFSFLHTQTTRQSVPRASLPVREELCNAQR